MQSSIFKFIGMTKLLIGVGIGAIGSLDDFEVIDIDSSSTTCEKIANYPNPVYSAVGALGPNDQPLICGGVPHNKECYSLQNGRWQLSSLMNNNRANAAMTQSPFPSEGSSFILTGGENTSQPLDSSEILIDNSWQLSTSHLPLPMICHCMIQINFTTVMTIGGSNSSYLQETYIFNAEIEQWVLGPLLNFERDELACGRILSNGDSQQFSFIAVGGQNGLPLKTTEILDDLTGNWIYGPELPITLTLGSLVEDPAGGVILTGGYNPEVPHHNTLYRLAHAEAKWIKMPQSLKTARYHHVAFLIPDKLVNCTLSKFDNIFSLV